MSYHHLTIEERACIDIYLKEKRTITEIANLLQRNKSTISREIHRNKNNRNEYYAIGSNRKYHQRRRKCVRETKLTNQNLFEMVCAGLNRYWSPEQICNTLPEGYYISTSTIYRALKKQIFPKVAAQKLRRYGKQSGHKKKGICYDFSKVRTFDQRPPEIQFREEFGHWELDTVVLRPECGCHLATLVERKSRYLIVKRIPNKKASTMADTVIATLKQVPKEMVKTLTVDRGLEFTDWERIETELNAKVYFCDPYKPSQRGTNENTNGLIRQFFPRRTILPPITTENVETVQSLINDRPRKILSWSSPYQIFCCT